ncbi:MAG: S-layer homology domain-containing protein [Candidatus Peribacteraceae bacterium]|nr:S-layer homology domain-containing protein [Candidatus Peribacteraceae bacterium]MDD5739300.1 S-layer homology domain-containing protein [Candidatus Peribacteraceae bacterium]
MRNYLLAVTIGAFATVLALPISLGIAKNELCEPYKCADGMRVGRCDANGTVIEYLVDPCNQHGGQVDTLPMSFVDVSSTHPNADAIAFVKSQGIVSGYADGTFRPDQYINRAELLKILVLSIQTSNPDFHCTFKTHFSDVDEQAWYGEYLCKVLWDPDAWVEGYPDGTFRPTAPINFVEAAKILDRALDFTGTEGKTWYEGYARQLANRNAIPLSIKRFDQSITRGEMAEMIYRLRANIQSQPSRTFEELSV